MRPDGSPSKIRTVKLVGYVGKALTATICTEDSARDPRDFTGLDAYGCVMDQNDNEVFKLYPTTGGASGTFIINYEILAQTPGWYRWEGGLTDSSGEREPLFRGPVHIRTY